VRVGSLYKVTPGDSPNLLCHAKLAIRIDMFDDGIGETHVKLLIGEHVQVARVARNVSDPGEMGLLSKAAV
jgi:hypothetical protein